MKLLYPFWNSDERRLRATWRLTLHLLITVIALIACAPFLIGIELLGITQSSSFIAGALAQTVALTSASLFCYVLIDRRRLSDLQLGRTFARELLDGCLIGALLMAGILIVSLICGWITVERIGVASAQQWLSLLAWQLMWLMLMTMVGISEEFFSRGQQLKNLAEGLKPLGIFISVLFAVVLSSAFFGLLHAGNPSATWFSTASIMGAGVMLSLARIFSGRLALPIGIHLTWNYFQGPVFGFAVSGQEVQNSLMEVSSTGPTWLTGGEFGPEAGVIGIVAMVVGVAFIAAWRKLSNQASSQPLEFEVFKLASYKKLRRSSPRNIKQNAVTSDGVQQVESPPIDSPTIKEQS